ncbi:hypothetical protein PoB_005798000 [Plakobranchus ocellatus]|uniref:Uncharacterized protein n=1 Tax=Plakobranchus ocellatus TaxID=259542 RepID=A0AAV4CI49_9GAST|nr:hypothetical protein PoB_005798000 [Plakobranchus ocellatus]
MIRFNFGGVSGTVASESALRSARTLLSWIRAPPPAPWPDGGPESLISSSCGLIQFYQTKIKIALLWTKSYCRTDNVIILLNQINWGSQNIGHEFINVADTNSTNAATATMTMMNNNNSNHDDNNNNK